MKDLYFKVKKIEKNGDVYTGIVIPCFERGWTWSNTRLVDDTVEFLTLSGERIRFKKGANFQTTRITDKDVKELIDSIIFSAKEEYKLKMKMTELNKVGEDILKESNIKNDEVSEKLSAITRCQGMLTKTDFVNTITPRIKSSYAINYVISNNKLLKVELDKSHDLGRGIKNGDYSFLYLEYDDNVSVYENYKEDKQFKSIKAKYFKELKNKKICGYTVNENTYPCGGGDKRSASVCQSIVVDLGKGIDLNKDSVSKTCDILKELFVNLK